jgi:hypothetical protein
MSDSEEYKRKLKAVFHGVTDTNAWVDCPHTIESGISSPPSYMVKLALFFIGEFSHCGTGDKTEWIAQVNYKDVNFEIRDWKGATWTIRTDRETPKTRATAKELKRKIESVASQIDKELSEELKHDVAEGKFLLNNPYPKIRYAYEWFRQKTCASADSSASEQKELRDKGLVIQPLIVPKENKSLYGYAMVGFYYSSLEFLFNVFYVLGDRRFDADFQGLPPGERFYKFRTRSWKERFAAVLPIGQYPALSRLYERLLHVKMDLRDELFHGFDGDENLLVPLHGVGLVPVSYESLTRSVHFSPVFADTAFIDRAMEVFESFDSWLESNPPWACYVRYAESGFEIPFSGKRLREIRSATEAGLEALEEWLDDEAAYRAHHSW